MIILGIDPGTATTGYGVIEKLQNQKRLACLEYGVIKTAPTSPHPERLKQINKELNIILNRFTPQILVIENVYFFKNMKTALPVSQAKGVILFTAAKKNIPIHEFTPLQVKFSLSGNGKMEKKQVQKMVKSLFRLKDIPKPDDAADALAIAACYFNYKKPSKTSVKTA